MYNELKDILLLCKELTQSNDISVILDAAEKIQKFNREHSDYNFSDILPNLYVNSPIDGILKTELKPYQQKSFDSFMKDDFHKFIIAPRQTGKTVLLAYIALVLVYTTRNKNIVIMSPKVSFSIEILNKIKNNYNCDNTCYKPGLISFNEKVIRFDNGTSIWIRPCDPNSSRGATIDYLLIDEVCYISHSYYENYMKCMMPTFHNTKILMVSTPSSSTSPMLYDLYQNPDKSNFTIDRWENTLPEDRIDYYKDTFGTDKFNIEFGNTLNK